MEEVKLEGEDKIREIKNRIKSDLETGKTLEDIEKTLIHYQEEVGLERK